MKTVILANIITFFGSLIMISVGLIKKKKHILLVQCFQFGIMGTGNLLLGGYTGVIANLIGVARNLLCLRFPFTVFWKILFISVQAVLSFLTNNAGLIGWLPFAATAVYTLFLDTTSDLHLKLLIVFGQICWAIYDLTIQNYSALLFDVLTLLSCLVGIFLLTKQRHNPTQGTA